METKEFRIKLKEAKVFLKGLKLNIKKFVLI